MTGSDAGSDVDDASTNAPRDARVAAVRTYYRALDEGAYDDLRATLAPGFVQDRSDRTFDGRDAFVRFMRDDRPDATTTHELTGVYVPTDEDDASDGDGDRPGQDGDRPNAEGDGDVLARGVVRRADGSAWFRFVDAFAFDDDGAISHLVTFARESVDADPGDD